MSIERFTKDEFEKALNNIKDGWHRSFSGGEYRYEINFGKKGVIFVNSSVGSDGIAKSTGKDSIRVYIEYDGKFMKDSTRWTTRLPGWQERLAKTVSKMCKMINDLDYNPKCPVCDGAMVLRKGVHGLFYGCLKFPACRGTRSYEAELPKELEWVKY